MRLSLLAASALFAFGCVENNLNVASTKVAVNPSLLDLGTAAPGSSVAGALSISSVGLGALTVASLTVAGNDADAFVVDGDFGGTVLAKGDSLEVPIVFTPTSEGPWEADLTVQTDANSGEAAVEVHLRGLGASPRLVIAPSAVDFGHAEPGPDVFQTLVLQCVSAVDATLLSAELSGDLEFYLVPVTTPALIGSATTLELSVAFGPTDTAARESVLTLTTDDPQHSSVLIPVTANVCLGDAALDVDSDGYSGCAGDCDDADASAVPGGVERIDGIDNDCDGLADEGTDAYDDDGDGYTEGDGDCNDNDAGVAPGSAEDIDGVDDDCDGAVDDGTDAYDDDGDGFTERGGDCDDASASTSPGAPEIPDGIDNDCDGEDDEDTASGDDDGDGYDEAAGDCDDADATVSPGGSESANGIDDNCDGTVDEGTDAYDDDGDGYTEDGGDCNDADTGIGPHQLEVIGDGIDNDCDGSAA